MPRPGIHGAAGRRTCGELIAVGFLLATSWGCSRQQEPIFDATNARIAWPAAPAQQRVRWVGELRSEADLKAQRSFFAAMGDLLVGAKEPETLYGPRGLVKTASDKLWIADPGGRCLHVFDLRERRYLRIETAGASKLLSPVDVCLGPDNSVYVCDSETIEIHRFNAERMTYLETLSLPEELGRPAAMAFDADAGELFVVDVAAHNIKVLEPTGWMKRVLGGRGVEPGKFNFPCDVALDGDTLWVADTGNNRVQQIRRDGEPVQSFGQAGDAPGDMAMPKSLALDSDGHVYVVDSRFENIQIFDQDGRLLLIIGEEGVGPGEFWLPAGVFIDTGDRIWVCDSYNARVQVFDYLPMSLSEQTPPADDTLGEKLKDDGSGEGRP